MKIPTSQVLAFVEFILLLLPVSAVSPTPSLAALPRPRQADGDGRVEVSGELKQWHKVTLTLAGPFAHEQDVKPDPFTDNRMSVAFKHADGTTYVVPGYFAANGNAADLSAESGTAWRAHFAPDRPGVWAYTISFQQGPLAAPDDLKAAGRVAPFDGQSGSITIHESDKDGRDLRAHGRLQYVGKHYLQFAGSKKYFLKAGADAPETMLGYADFDGTPGQSYKVPLKTWSPHLRDWRDGDPTWKDGMGKGLIGEVVQSSRRQQTS